MSFICTHKGKRGAAPEMAVSSHQAGQAPFPPAPAARRHQRPLPRGAFPPTPTPGDAEARPGAPQDHGAVGQRGGGGLRERARESGGGGSTRAKEASARKDHAAAWRCLEAYGKGVGADGLFALYMSLVLTGAWPSQRPTPIRLPGPAGGRQGAQPQDRQAHGPAAGGDLLRNRCAAVSAGRQSGRLCALLTPCCRAQRDARAQPRRAS